MSWLSFFKKELELTENLILNSPMELIYLVELNGDDSIINVCMSFPYNNGTSTL